MRFLPILLALSAGIFTVWCFWFDAVSTQALQICFLAGFVKAVVHEFGCK